MLSLSPTFDTVLVQHVTSEVFLGSELPAGQTEEKVTNQRLALAFLDVPDLDVLLATVAVHARCFVLSHVLLVDEQNATKWAGNLTK